MQNVVQISLKPVHRASGLRRLASRDTTNPRNQSHCLDNGHRETPPALELRHEAKAGRPGFAARSMSLTRTFVVIRAPSSAAALSTANPRLPNTPTLAQVVATGIEWTATPADALGHGEWETKAPQEEGTERVWVDPRFDAC